MDDPLSSVGERIAFARKMKGLDQEPVARAAGITKAALSQIETGVTKQPKPETLFRIADALDADPRFLVFGHLDRVAPSLSAIRTTGAQRFRVRRNAKNGSQ